MTDLKKQDAQQHLGGANRVLIRDVLSEMALREDWFERSSKTGLITMLPPYESMSLPLLGENKVDTKWHLQHHTVNEMQRWQKKATDWRAGFTLETDETQFPQPAPPDAQLFYPHLHAFVALGFFGTNSLPHAVWCPDDQPKKTVGVQTRNQREAFNQYCIRQNSPSPRPRPSKRQRISAEKADEQSDAGDASSDDAADADEHEPAWRHRAQSLHRIRDAIRNWKEKFPNDNLFLLFSGIKAWNTQMKRVDTTGEKEEAGAAEAAQRAANRIRNDCLQHFQPARSEADRKPRMDDIVGILKQMVELPEVMVTARFRRAPGIQLRFENYKYDLISRDEWREQAAMGKIRADRLCWLALTTIAELQGPGLQHYFNTNYAASNMATTLRFLTDGTLAHAYTDTRGVVTCVQDHVRKVAHIYDPHAELPSKIAEQRPWHQTLRNVAAENENDAASSSAI